MRRTFAIGLTAAMSAVAIGLAAPVHASASEECFPDRMIPIGLQSVSVNLQTLEIRIDPAAIDDDVNWAVGLVLAEIDYTIEGALCVEGGVVTGPVRCLVAKAREIAGSLDPANLYFRYVYVDPATGEIVIPGGQLVADATACQ